jgi:hypothetical protein
MTQLNQKTEVSGTQWMYLYNTVLTSSVIKNNTSKNWEHFYTVLKHNIFFQNSSPYTWKHTHKIHSEHNMFYLNK